MMTLIELIGILGSLIVCGSILPQLVRTYRTKSARDLSISSLSTLMTGLILLMIYSIHVQDLVFILGNSLSIISVGILMGLWRRYQYRHQVYGRIIPIRRKEQNPCRS